MSNIEWTDVTWNPVIGCTPVSPGCLNCYAATMARRLEAMGKAEYGPRRVSPDGSSRIGIAAELLEPGTKTIRIADVRNGRAVYTGDVRMFEHRLTEPLSWKKPRTVFVCSMSDLFHDAVPFAFIDRVFAIMALCPQHTFQVLTKRPDRMAEYTANPGRLSSVAQAAAWMGRAEQSMQITWPLANVWLGTSVENQQVAEHRIPHLLKCPAAVRFLSCEPLLGPVNIGRAMCTCPWPEDAMQTRHLMDCPADTRRPEDQRRWAHLHWIIVGGESGHNARPFRPAWARSIVKQCDAAGVPAFVKQMGSHVEIANDSADEWPDADRIWDTVPANYRPSHQGEFVRVKLKHSKGSEMAEWPADLRVRQMPGGATC